MSDAPETYIASQLKGIVGVEIDIAAIDGKWKVSQNRPQADIVEVAEGLISPSDPHASEEMAHLVGEYGDRAGRR